jgi:hypothetical protein
VKAFCRYIDLGWPVFLCGVLALQLGSGAALPIVRTADTFIVNGARAADADATPQCEADPSSAPPVSSPPSSSGTPPVSGGRPVVKVPRLPEIPETPVLPQR